ncbi:MULTISPECIES: hypothetical protein [Photobacterium]|jgi:hypothetical protein|uniref:hypothetical protein n=1 Tax=Photobacterium TaxID=657 RepID=UPI000D15D261|nr:MULTISPECIES: hypothetical protein [Photobacterium]MCD9465755.1 hypothetical protein [Photobacterium iliopiscarium]MCD9487234.1 hypothetical protein [Photobacterium iliopiscarium]MCD9545706.1 hypothetical protein [Photobacterium carnosum]MCF2244491.1 hypothetical protein [Photobacterium iliopiscarium]PST96546.1 hypothetical protein C9I87_03100 [Photobacterium iliopiscarium]
MSYLHVTIKTKSSNGWLCIFKDLSVSDLKKNLVRPYKLGNSIYYDGNILSSNEITQVKITETENSHEAELKVVQDESFRGVQEFNRASSSIVFISAGHGYSDYEINKCGKDVTGSYISSGPEEGTPLTMLAEFIKHPWVVRIVGGLVFLVVAAYLGLK